VKFEFKGINIDRQDLRPMRFSDWENPFATPQKKSTSEYKQNVFSIN
jgi:hypothetical protein